MASPFTPSYEEAQLEEVRKALRHQLKQLGTEGVISQLVSELQLNSDTHPVQADQALQVLQDRGIVEQIARSISAAPHLVAKAAASNLLQAAATPAQAAGPTSGGQRYLQVKLLGARAVVDYVARPPLAGERLQLSLELLGHRLDSGWVPAGAEPAFTGEMFIPLPMPDSPAQEPGGVLPDPLQLLSLRPPLHLVMVSSTPTTLVPASDIAASVQGPAPGPLGPWPDPSHSCSACSVVAMGAGDWRTCLLRTRPVVVCIQMGSGPGMALGVPGGSAPACVVTLQLCLHPRPATPLDEGMLQAQQRTEASRDAQCSATFVQRAKGWWSQYTYLAQAFRTRPIKVLARSEDGAQRPSCFFVRPLQLGRAVPTPRHAARLVSLMRQRDADGDLAHPSGSGGGAGALSGVAGASAECWCCLHTILASRSASSEEMALLLCGLFLGFGLDAFVAVGRRRNGEGVMWVVTRAAFAHVTHWQPSTGTRFTSLDEATCPFHTIGSLFNHQHVYANRQPDDSVMSVSYLLEEPSLWHEMHVAPAEVPGPAWSSLVLRAPLLDSGSLEQALEQQIKAVLAHQQDGPLPTWDVSLEHLLMPALEAYEYEAVTGEAAPGTEEFQAAIKRVTPVGWEFKVREASATLGAH